jgi:ATP-dependent Lon protease
MQNPEVDEYLNEVKTHIIENLDDFKTQEPQGPALPFMPTLPQRELFLEYDVNVVVDNAHIRGAPVLIESSPTYLNLFGTIERVVDRGGRLVTNFTRIKSGSLLRAHGGYLIFNLEDALTEPVVWKALKRTLKSGRIEMETYEPFALFSTSGLKPEPVQIQVKVVVVGSPLLYHLLYTLDEEFRDIFKVHADFRHSMKLDPEHLTAYGKWAAQVCQGKISHISIAPALSAWWNLEPVALAIARKSPRRSPKSPTSCVKPPTGRARTTALSFLLAMCRKHSISAPSVLTASKRNCAI